MFVRHNGVKVADKARWRAIRQRLQGLDRQWPRVDRDHLGVAAGQCGIASDAPGAQELVHAIAPHGIAPIMGSVIIRPLVEFLRVRKIGKKQEGKHTSEASQRLKGLDSRGFLLDP